MWCNGKNSKSWILKTNPKTSIADKYLDKKHHMLVQTAAATMFSEEVYLRILKNIL